MASTTAEGVNCPKCDGPMWDNTKGKRNPKAPDYKCKNKACAGVIWPDKRATVIEKPEPNDRRGRERELLRPQEGDDESTPDWLRGASDEDMRELRERTTTAPVNAPRNRKEAYGLAQFQSTRIALEVLAPLYKKHGIDLPADTAHKHAFELMKFWDQAGLIK